jgi:hypothetical protein
MSAFSRFTPLASALPSTVPFVGPEAIERQRGLLVKARIGANENGFGPAPSVLAAMREQAGDIWKYNDPENHTLKEALAAHLGNSGCQHRHRRWHRRVARPDRAPGRRTGCARRDIASADIRPSTSMLQASAAGWSLFLTARIAKIWTGCSMR